MSESANASINRILTENNLEPHRGLGQNFLIDDNIYNKILEVADIKKDDCVLEIGTGLATLTKKIAEKTKHLVTVENDKKLIPIIKKELADREHFILLEGSILSISMDELWDSFDKKCDSKKIVANIPYYITGKILRKFLPEKSISRIVLLVQYEVATRMRALRGDMTMLSLTAQWYANITIAAKVSKNSFFPSPKVDSAIIVLDRKDDFSSIMQGNLTELDVFSFARMAFNQKRKKISNSLAAGLHSTNGEVASRLVSQKIDPNSRPQDIAIEDWIKISSCISDLQK